MNYENLLTVCQYVTEKTGVELKLKYSKFITNKQLNKESNYLNFFDFTAKNGRDRLMQRKHAKEKIESIKTEQEKEYMVKYRKNMRDLPICDDKVTETSTPVSDFMPLTLKEHGKQTWFSCRKPFENDSVKDCILRCVEGLKKEEIEAGKLKTA